MVHGEAISEGLELYRYFHLGKKLLHTAQQNEKPLNMECTTIRTRAFSIEGTAEIFG